MTANIRTPQRTVSAMQRFAVSQKNHAEAITISPFLLSLPYRTENRRFSALSCTKTGGTQPKLSAACFVVQSCLADADSVFFALRLNSRRKSERFHFGALLLNFLRKFNHFRTSLPASPTSPDILSGKSHIPSEMPGKKRNNPEIQTPGRRS